MAVTVLKGSLALAGLLLVAQAQATELLNSSYDVSRELFAALNPPFEQQWAKDNNGDKLTIKQSHAGSSKQALAILQGLKADVVTYNQVTDVQILHDKGKLPGKLAEPSAKQQLAVLFHHGLPGAQGQPEEHPRLERPGAFRRKTDFPEPKNLRQRALYLSGGMGRGG